MTECLHRYYWLYRTDVPCSSPSSSARKSKQSLTWHKKRSMSLPAHQWFLHCQARWLNGKQNWWPCSTLPGLVWKVCFCLLLSGIADIFHVASCSRHFCKRGRNLLEGYASSRQCLDSNTGYSTWHFSQIGDHSWAGHTSAISTVVHSSCITLHRHLLTWKKGGKAYTWKSAHLTSKTSVITAWGSGLL